MAESRKRVLSLFRCLLRESQKFRSYNYRMYALRRTKDAFKENKTETDAEKVSALIKRAKDNLEIIKRQVSVTNMYGTGKVVIEQTKPLRTK